MKLTKSEVGPIEVWLTQRNMEVVCLLVREDESAYHPSVDSLSMRGAQREITGWLVDQGYEPVGRWEYAPDTFNGECSRHFKPGEGAQFV